MKAIRVPALTDEQRDELDELYRTTKVPRLRTRAQMVLLAAERELKVPDIAAIVRESADTVARWLKRYLAEGLEGLERFPIRLTPVYTHNERTKPTHHWAKPTATLSPRRQPSHLMCAPWRSATLV